MDDPAFTPETDLQTQAVILAATNHDIPTLRNLLRHTSANVQDPETGCTPLHAAIAACERENNTNGLASNHAPGSGAVGNGEGHVNGGTGGHVLEELDQDQDLEAAVKTIRLLFEKGAIWNDLDMKGETPGCVAWRLGLKVLYEMCVDAGVRAELLLARLDAYQVLRDNDSEDDGEEEDGSGGGGGDGGENGGEGRTAEGRDDGEHAADLGEEVTDGDRDTSTQNANFLSSNLTFDRNKIVDEAANGVMMRWETAIMKESAAVLAPSSGLRVLNVGHGMGIIDTFFHETRPKSHHIIEAHPDVLSRMKNQDWDSKPGVIVHAGCWQDIVPKLLEAGELFDAIYFDTFAEEYSALRQFFTESVIGLLDPKGGESGEGGRFGFFNGMGADRQVCYHVYNKVVELDLLEAGFDVEWKGMAVPDLDGEGEWEGVRRKYWAVEEYRLPTCTYIG